MPNIGPSSAERPPRADAGRPYVEIDAVRKIYNPGPSQIEAVSEVSFTVRPREFVSILGPSGCGKSTLLMMIGGLEPPTAGAVRIAGKEVRGPRAETGIIFQDPTLLPWKTVLENVLFPVRIQQRDVARYRSRALELLHMVGLYPFRDKRPHQLSGGMKQRAAICRALVCDPDLLLMDEPFSALDAITRDELNVALLDIWERHHKTGLFVTHSIREAVFLSDRVIVMGLRPSRIVAEVPIGFSRPREIHLQESPEFSGIVAMLRDQIGSQHG